MPSKSSIFTPLSILFRPHQKPVRRDFVTDRFLVEAPDGPKPDTLHIGGSEADEKGLAEGTVMRFAKRWSWLGILRHGVVRKLEGWAMTDYAADVKTYDASADDAIIAKIVRHLGIALRNRDSSMVSCSDPAELARVKEKWCGKKLGVDGDADGGLRVRRIVGAQRRHVAAQLAFQQRPGVGATRMDANPGQRPVGQQEQPAPAHRVVQRLWRQHDRLQPQAHRVQRGVESGGFLEYIPLRRCAPSPLLSNGCAIREGGRHQRGG
eukprot:gene11494-15359_t